MRYALSVAELVRVRAIVGSIRHRPNSHELGYPRRDVRVEA